jgi:hypothetical protein
VLVGVGVDGVLVVMGFTEVVVMGLTEVVDVTSVVLVELEMGVVAGFEVELLELPLPPPPPPVEPVIHISI